MPDEKTYAEEHDGFSEEFVINHSTLVPVNLLHPSDWNPNEESEDQFAQLVAEIQEDGFDDPLVVTPWEDYPDAVGDEPHYRIIAGEHRWRAAKVIGYTELPCFVKEGWDEQKEKLKTVRRNLLSGSINDTKLTALTKSLMAEHEYSPEELSRMMAFSSESEFNSHLVEEVAAEVVKDEDDEDDGDFMSDGFDEEGAGAEMDAVETLDEVIGNIFSSYGETLPQNFMFFAYKGKMHLMVMMDKELKDKVDVIINEARESKEDINDKFKELL